MWLLDEDDKTSILEPRPQDQIVVRLKSHASSGYLWHVESMEAAEQEGFQLEPLTIPSVHRQGDPLHFGSPETMDYLLTGGRRLSGRPVDFLLAERMPWVEGASFRYILVQGPLRGLGDWPDSLCQEAAVGGCSVVITAEVLLGEFDSPARPQGSRPTCLAFALCDLNRRFSPTELSPEYLSSSCSAYP